MTPDEATNTDPAPLQNTMAMIRKAMGVLREIAEDPVQRANYERRVEVMRQRRQPESDPQAHKPEISNKRQAEVLAGQIQFFQWLLDHPRASSEDLGNLSLDELRRLADELRQRAGASS